ncbi:carotenoid 1,2-hydratase [Rhodoferax sp.]|uniref:lipocalin-like domain-containing protein n=1 Tax=Rhodoferax sp. TaxID=50421 RepID=UPI0028496706|nr:carotenoid 1,2-hydratase [Rhodoferax sp.]MDR3370415.1 carotenoid 1,2-hydratase [Rhodoferax sp.]
MATALSAPLWPSVAQAQSGSATPMSQALAKRHLQFPRDLGSHPDTAIEWWYVTGELQAQQRRFGFQLTFFRSRVPSTQGMRSAFVAKQLIFAHAAVTDVAGQRLLHDQRIARSSGDTKVDLARASEADTDVTLRDWSLQRRGTSYQARAKGQDFAFDLALLETQPLLLQGDQGLSRKGPQPEQASYYYSLPQLAVTGELTLAGQAQPVTGRAWLDHEWSQSIMAPVAVGWDWIGMNLDDGSALTAFRLRDKAGGTVWAGGSWRAKGAATPMVFAPEQVVFKPERFWKSPASGSTYPVQWAVEVPVGESGTVAPQRYTVRAVVDNQELDSSRSTGAIYWEGLSELLDAQGHRVGRGYLEMTGYAQALKL